MLTLVLRFILYLLWLHVSGGEIFDTVHEAVLRHLVIRPQKLFKLKHEGQSEDAGEVAETLLFWLFL